MNDETDVRNVRVLVKTRHIPDRSRPEDGTWFFSYRIELRNEGKRAVQLLGRHWVIEDAEGHREEVRGRGVIGEQPLLQPGESFTYVSGCPLRTPMGSMRGHYVMRDDTGDLFRLPIPPFSLCEPLSIN